VADNKDAAQKAMATLLGRVREATQQTAMLRQAFSSTVPRAPKRALDRAEVAHISGRFRHRLAEIAALQAFLIVLTWTKESS
jgi:hypothetical protein